MSDPVKGNVFITGASGGIGEATASLLAQRGYRVFAGSRSGGGDAAERAAIQGVQVDVTDPGSVAGAVAEVTAGVGGEGLVAVVNNAGVIVQGPLELVPAAELQRQFAVNTLGPSYVAQQFLPLLRAGGGRVVNVSAPTARVPVPFMGPIGASKAALQSLSDALRVELSPWRIPVVLVEPRATATRIFEKAQTAADAALATIDPQLRSLYGPQLEAFAKAGAAQKLGPVDKVAEMIVKAIEARHPKRLYTVGAEARAASVLSRLPPTTRDRLVASALGVSKVKAPMPTPS